MRRTETAPRHAHDDDHDDHGGLVRDLVATHGAISRRRALHLAARVGAAFGTVHLLGCGDSTSPTTDGVEPTTGGISPSTGVCTRVPEETAGPYPGDGSNGPSVLAASGVVRSDLRSSFAGLSGTADGVPLTLELTLVSATNCAVLAGRAVYLWHCDRAGRYSLYSSGVVDQNWLRGVQVADAGGIVRFTTIFPGCYAGRWPHMHFEVFPSLAASSAWSGKVATSQIALPKAACDSVYATSGYASSATNLGGVSLASDGIFSDGAQLQLATVTGDVSSGLRAALTVAVAGA